jgi:hypothetical protein
LASQDTERVVGVGVVGIGAKDFSVKLTGLAQIARLVVSQCQGKDFGNGRHKKVK